MLPQNAGGLQRAILCQHFRQLGAIMHANTGTYVSFFASLACCAVAAISVVQADEKPLGTGERIVFLGDSVTQAGAGPTGYVTLVRQALEHDHASLGVEVIGAGISGNKVPDLEKRLERDVLSKKPTLVFIYIGINDVWHSQSGRGTSKEDFEKGLRSILARIRDTGADPSCVRPA